MLKNAMLKKVFASAVLAGLVAAGAVGGRSAQAQVKVSEIWQSGSSSTTPDWFELTNLGGSTIDPSTLFFDDDSGDPSDNGNPRLAGITSLASGESAVYMVSWHDDFDDFNDAVTSFSNFWGTAGAYQIGYILDDETEGGPGLSGGGDQVNVFAGNLPATLLDAESYTGGNGNQTWVWNPGTDMLQTAQVGVLGGHTSVNGAQTGSPGVVPEPTTFVLGAAGLIGLAIARRRFAARRAK